MSKSTVQLVPIKVLKVTRVLVRVQIDDEIINLYYQPKLSAMFADNIIALKNAENIIGAIRSDDSLKLESFITAPRDKSISISPNMFIGVKSNGVSTGLYVTRYERIGDITQLTPRGRKVETIADVIASMSDELNALADM